MLDKMRHILSLALILMTTLCHSQGWQGEWHASARMGGTTGQYMPFWARTGESGILPVTSAAQVAAGGRVCGASRQGFHLEAGASFAAALAARPYHEIQDQPIIVDRLYVKGGWRMLHAELGMCPRTDELGPLSLTGGNVIMTGNARNIPGLNLRTDWICLDPKHIVGVRANLAEYVLMDRRYVSRSRLHNKSVGLKLALGSKVDFIGGFEHWAQWGGTSPEYGPQPVSFKDYVRVFFAQGGGDGATWSDQVNAIGNHLGREFIRMAWRASAFTMTFQYDKPFEDGSGMRLHNFPDGVWSLGLSLNDRNAFVTDLMYELATTTWQSGPLHDRPATEEEMARQDPSSPYYGKIILMGNDDYFNNGEYRSGWTYYGRPMGLPVMIPAAPEEDGRTYGFVSNRVRAHHLGVKGNAGKVPYLLRVTCSRHFGRWSRPDDRLFCMKPWQLSMGLDADLSFMTGKLPLDFTVGVYGDLGKVLPSSAGLVLKINYNGLRFF